MARWSNGLLSGVLFLCGAVVQAEPFSLGDQCVPPGKVLIPASMSWTDNVGLLQKQKDSQVILLGEHHDNIEHHRWQLQMIAGIHALHPNMVLGFEMFPRETQPVLDRWVAGELSEEELLKQARWEEYWSFDSSLYLPLFHYARMNKVPMYALNVERSLIRSVGMKGWDEVDEAEKEGVSKPAPASEAYRELLAGVFVSHVDSSHNSEASPEDKIKKVLEMPAFNRFVESQSVWDRAMAEGINKGIGDNKDATVVAIMGSGHMMYGFGVPEQLAALGVDKASVLIPWDTEFECSYIDDKFADAVIGLTSFRQSEKDAERPRLGIYLDKDERGVLVKKVIPNSVAYTSQIHDNDIIVEMAGKKITAPDQVVEMVKNMQFGTWLPIKVMREAGEYVEIIAKFPVLENMTP